MIHMQAELSLKGRTTGRVVVRVQRGIEVHSIPMSVATLVNLDQDLGEAANRAVQNPSQVVEVTPTPRMKRMWA